jgi:hypothetical protein
MSYCTHGGAAPPEDYGKPCPWCKKILGPEDSGDCGWPEFRAPPVRVTKCKLCGKLGEHECDALRKRDYRPELPMKTNPAKGKIKLYFDN